MRARRRYPYPTTVFASQVECAAEKQEPGLIFKVQIKPFPSALAGSSAVCLQITDSQSCFSSGRAAAPYTSQGLLRPRTNSMGDGG